MQSAGEVAPAAHAPNRQKSRRQIPRRRKLMFVSVLVAFACLLAEVGVRIRAWVRYGSSSTGVTDDMMIFDPASDLVVPKPGYVRSGQKISIHINSLGFRGAEISRLKPNDCIRIACVGASTTFCGEASSDSAAWPQRLEHLLRQRFEGQRFEVINAGVPGYTAAQSLKNLRHRVIPLDPDIVIFYEANNELAAATRELAESRGLIRPRQGRRSGLLAFVGRYSLLADLVDKNLRILLAEKDAEHGTLSDIPRDLPNVFIETIDEMAAELQSRSVPFVLSTYLVKYRRDQDRNTQIANADVAFYYMPWMTIEALVDGIDAYNDAIIEYAKAHGLPVVEDCDSIPADSDHFADCMHLTDAGCSAMASRFADYLARSGLIDQAIEKAKSRAITNSSNSN
jgi:lysophospholipase L1-like esterase